MEEEKIDPKVAQAALKSELLIMAIYVSNLAVIYAKKIRRKIVESATEEGRQKVNLSKDYYKLKVKSLTDSKENISIRKCVSNFDNHLSKAVDSTLEFVASALDKAYEEMKPNIWTFECEVKNVLKGQVVEDSNLLGMIDMDMRLLATAHIFIEDLFSANPDIIRKYFWLLNDIKSLYSVMGSVSKTIPIYNTNGKVIGQSLPKITECERVVNAYKKFVNTFYDPDFIERIMLYALDKTEEETKESA